MLLPMVHDLRDPLGSMGNDSALAVLSDKQRMLYDYFKQLFAQVSNPAIDSIREKIIMSLECYIGPEKNILHPGEGHADRLLVDHPILTSTALYALKHLDHEGHKSKVIDITFNISDSSTEDLKTAVNRVCQQAEEAVDNGVGFLVLSDRSVNHEFAAISSLMACGAIHHHLTKVAKRTKTAIIIETAEAREVHHFCLLFGYGADAINPYLAYETLIHAKDEG